jgi:hypothetical protein
MSTNLKALIDKLNDTTRKALEAAAGLCVARTHYDIEIEHYQMKLLDRGRLPPLTSMLAISAPDSRCWLC